MGDSKKTNDFLDFVTVELQGDPELRLEARREVAARLESERAKYLAQGDSEEKSEYLAVQSFGPAAEFGNALAKTYAERLRRRKRVRQALRFGLWPLALLIAILVCRDIASSWTETRRVHRDCAFRRLMSYWKWKWLEWPTRERIIERERQRANTETKKSREAWSLDPDNHALARQYAGRVLWNNPFDKSERTRQAATRVREFSKLAASDPDNAYFDYLVADTQAQISANIYGDTIIVTDRALFDQALETFSRGARKPRCSRYQRTVIDALLAELARGGNHAVWVEKLQRIYPYDYSYFRQLQRYASLSAKKALSGGDTRQAATLSRDFDAFIRQLIEDIVFIRDVSAIEPEALRKRASLDNSKSAARLLKILDSLGAIPDYPRVTLPNGGLLSWPFFRFLASKDDSVPDALKTPGRRSQYIAEEIFALNILVLSLLFCAIFCSVIAVAGRLFRKKDFPALRPLPDTKKLGVIVLGGVVAPILAYWVYSRFDSLSGTFYEDWLNLRFEALALGVTLIAITGALARKYALSRLTALGVIVNTTSKRPFYRWGMGSSRQSTWLLVGALWIVAFFVDANWWKGDRGTIWFCVLVVFLAICVGLWNVTFGKGAEAVARTLATVFVLTAALLMLTLHPLLRYRERSLIANDPIIFGDNGKPIFYWESLKRGAEAREKLLDALEPPTVNPRSPAN